jgi:hypothetical protein
MNGHRLPVPTFVPNPKKFYPSGMPLRIVLRLLITIGLLLQGGVGATTAYAAGASGHHCHPSAGHDGPARKCPCCPSRSPGMTCADACMTVAALPVSAAIFNLPVLSIAPSGEPTRMVVVSIDPPLRPPIV